MTNSSSPPPPKTSANWPRSFLHRSKRGNPDYKGTRAPFRSILSAPARPCFFAESAGSGLSPQTQANNAEKSQADIQLRILPETDNPVRGDGMRPFVASGKRAAPTIRPL